MLRSERLKLERASKQLLPKEDPVSVSDSELEEAMPVAKGIDFESLPAVQVLAKLDDEFYVLLESSKWTDRRDQLTKLEQLLDVERLENGSYFQLGHLLEKVWLCLGTC
jgi:hypothetical protein